MRKLTDSKIVVASHNSGKVREINDLLGPFGISARSAVELNLDTPEETGTTFEENAALKALAAATATGLPALADDSGLCVEALGGRPGVHTADWAELPDGTGRDFERAMARVNRELADADSKSRRAKFVAVLCLAWPDNHVECFRGEVEGQIQWPPRGDKGFGYDPIFLPDGHDRTFGEMTADEKHGTGSQNQGEGLSHRARAFAIFAESCLKS